MEKRQTSNSRNYSSYTNRSRTFGNSGEVIKSPSFTGNSITEYQEYLEAADKSSMDDLVGLIIGIEEVPENAFESLILPAPWMDPPKTVGDLSMNLIIIWILDAEELSDGGLKVAALLGNLAKLTISYSMIVHICRLLMEGKESALYLFFQLTKVDTFCQEVIDQHQQDILDCLEYSADQATKNEVKILSLCCMFHLATNSPELTEWLLNKYEVKDKIVDLFAEEKDGKNINIDIDIDVPVVIEEINEDSFERDKGSFTEEYKQILKKSIASSFQGCRFLHFSLVIV